MRVPRVHGSASDVYTWQYNYFNNLLRPAVPTSVIKASVALRASEREMTRRCRIGAASTTRRRSRRERARYPSCYLLLAEIHTEKFARAIFDLFVEIGEELLFGEMPIRSAIPSGLFYLRTFYIIS